MRRRARVAVEGGTAAPSTPWYSWLTIVICSSPVPSNPETATLRAGLASLAIVPGLLRSPKLIQFDGPQPALPPARIERYVEFKRRVRALAAADAGGAFASTSVYESSTFLFAAHNLAAAVERVNTSFLLSMQHDYQLARPFDAPGLLRSMLAAPVVRHVRLNMRSNFPARGFDGVVANATDLAALGVTVPLTRTCGWSDAPHIASTRYYRETCIRLNLADHAGGRRKFMEESLHYRMQRNFRPGGCWALKQARPPTLPWRPPFPQSRAPFSPSLARRARAGGDAGEPRPQPAHARGGAAHRALPARWLSPSRRRRRLRRCRPQGDARPAGRRLRRRRRGRRRRLAAHVARRL